MLLLVAALLSAAPPARAWDRHRALTEAALARLPSAALDAAVRGERLEDFLAATGRAGGEAGFLAAHKLNGRTSFPFLLGEEGSTVTLRAVVAAYADEPDHGMDQELFDQYPELWKPEYRYMGGDKGSQSRAFRHLFWPRGFLKEPEPPGRLPVPDFTKLGEAPERARLFFELSREAFRAGRPYWGGRFLAWSLHYLEDLTQPFHSVQLPTLRLLRFKPGGELDAEATGRTVAYFHLAADAYPSRALGGTLGKGPRGELGVVVGTATASRFPGPRAYCEEAAEGAAAEAADLADALLDLVPSPGPDDLKDPLGRVYSPEYWEELVRLHRDKPSEAGELLRRLGPRVEDLGVRARTWTAAALAPPPASGPAPAAPALPAPEVLLGRARELLRRHLRMGL